MKTRSFALFSAILATNSLLAGTYTWTGSAPAASGGQWNTTNAANWNGVNPVLDNTAVVNFTGTPTIVTYITWLGDNNRTVKTINCSGTFASPLEIRTNNNGTTGRTLTFSSDTGTASIDITGTVSQPVTIGQGTGANNNGIVTLASNLSVSHSGTADLTIGRPIGETGGARSITKAGSGTLVLSAANTFTGNVNIDSGPLRIGAGGALGTNAGDTLVANGATLDISNVRITTVGENVSIVGDGVGGLGALYSSAGNLDKSSVGVNLILTGDATVGVAAGRNGVTSGTFSTGGMNYTLTKVGNGQFDSEGSSVDVGNIVVNAGIFQAALTTTFNTGFPLTVNPGGEFRIFELATPFPRDIFLNSGTLNSTGTADFTGDTVAGNITQTGPNTISTIGGVNDLLIIAGNINEAAAGSSITKIGNRTARLAGTNTYTGATTINEGTLQAAGSFTSDFSVAALATLDGEGITTGTATFANTAILSFDASTTGTDQFFRAADVIIAGGDIVDVVARNISGGSNIVVIRDGNGGLNLADFNLINPGRGTLTLGGAGGNSDLLYNSNAANLVWTGSTDNIWNTNVTANFTNGGSPDNFLSNDNVSFVNAATGTVVLGNDIIAGTVTFNNSSGNPVTLDPTAAETLISSGITVAGSATNTISAVITGGTPMTVGGGGTLVLAANNTATGAITINSGTLQLGNGGAGGSTAATSISNNGNITVNRTDTATISNTISGGGSLDQTGSGTTLLNGNISYSGLTTVSAGILQFGGNAPGFLTGNILNNALLEFLAITDVTYGGQISGTGKVTKRNSANPLTLTGNNDFSGGLDIYFGTVVAGDANIGTGPVTFFGNGNASTWQLTGSSDNDILFANGASNIKLILFAPGVTDATLSGTITFADDSTTTGSSRISPIGGTIVLSGKMTGSGTGGYAKRNNGTVVITNTTNDYTGPTNIVDPGTLLVDGLVPGNVYFGENVNGTGGASAAGILGGSGTIGGNVKTQGGSNIAPGGTSSAGVTTPTAAVLTVTGDLDISAMAGGAGQLQFDLDAPAGTNDRIAAGTANIGTLGLNDIVINNLGGLAAGSYTLISSGGLTGVIDPGDDSGLIAPGFNGVLSLSANDVVLTVTSAGSPFSSWMSTYYPSITAPDNLPEVDFDNDGTSNFGEFAFGGIPDSGSSTGPRRSAIDSISSVDYLTLTIATRSGTVFSGSTPATGTKDNVTYTVGGSLGLATFTESVTEVVPAVTTGLPALGSGPLTDYEYHTFRITAPRTANPKAFLRAIAAPAP